MAKWLCSRDRDADRRACHAVGFYCLVIAIISMAIWAAATAPCNLFGPSSQSQDPAGKPAAVVEVRK